MTGQYLQEMKSRIIGKGDEVLLLVFSIPARMFRPEVTASIRETWGEFCEANPTRDLPPVMIISDEMELTTVRARPDGSLYPVNETPQAAPPGSDTPDSTPEGL